MDYTPSLLIVDDDTSAIRILSKAIGSLGKVRFATNGPDALRAAQEQRPDLVLLDAEMPGMGGFEVCERMKTEMELRDVPVIFITSHTEASMEEAGLALGAVDFIGKPIRPAIVNARVKTHLHLKLAMDRLNLLAQTDGLTGLANRRFLDQTIEREWLRTRRNGQPFSLLLMDIDYFKRYNDRNGHLQGDQCLIAVAHALRACINRPADLVARYGGEEFAVLLPETDHVGACRIADQLGDGVRHLNIPHPDSPHGNVTVSIGVASFDEESPSWPHSSESNEVVPNIARLLEFSDAALYEAKEAGRDCSRFRNIELAALMPAADPNIS
ncbi:diguanylate cyclase response regulator [Pseudomonas tohonis]|uniref:diguanylate cyclase n=1 Tax=Pseudomonas tohonis TaxID=2725477 RepID=A0A6J4E2T5_9PSED|nr:diguanylate cyclase [Pseudomonas tohonis]BCG23675.1 diguanylate cyclase response regulator [Pseudomonas tohonis]GJN51719.1 diguanylate cyclase response regulator [Pseudomonas tohonis]